MKKIFLPIAVSLLLSLGLASCVSDDSSMGDPSKVGSIEITEMPAQSVVSFAGHVLDINPEIKTLLDESDLEYAWYLYEEKKDLENGFRNNCISHDRNLKYEVNLSSGTYIVALEVKSKSTGLAKLSKFAINASTEFANAFFILKETADGNTDLDMVTDKGLSADIITKADGQPMPGKPLNLAFLYGQNYVNPDSYESMATNTVNVFTENDYHSYRSEDMKLIFDRKSISYAGEENPEYYTNIVNGYMYAFLISGNGVASKFYGDDWGATTGLFTLPTVEGNYGKFMQVMGEGLKGMAVWDNDSHGVSVIDYNCSYALPLSKDATGQEECLASGINRMGTTETVWFLSENKAEGKRFVTIIDGKKGKLTEKKELPASLHISKGTSFSACGNSAAIIYVVDAGKLYGYGWTNDTEAEIALPGFSGSVDFVSNQWFSKGDYTFDNLIVGSQSGNTYTLSFFDDLVGGTPNAPAYNKVTGTGKFKTIRRATPASVSSMNKFFPVSD